MSHNDIDELISDVSLALRQVQSLVIERDFLERVLKQAVLTHGGVLKVDPELYEAAKNDPRELNYGSASVTLEEAQ